MCHQVIDVASVPLSYPIAILETLHYIWSPPGHLTCFLKKEIARLFFTCCLLLLFPVIVFSLLIIMSPLALETPSTYSCNNKLPTRQHCLKVKSLLKLSNDIDKNERAMIYMQGADHSMRDDTDVELEFRQESNFFYLTGKPMSYCVGFVPYFDVDV